MLVKLANSSNDKATAGIDKVHILKWCILNQFSSIHKILFNHEIQSKKHIDLGEHLKLIQYDASVME